MKKLPIHSPHYKYILRSFKEWLDVLGYAPATVYSMPHYVQEYLHYLEQQGKRQIVQIENKSIKEHYSALKQRSNTRRGGGLSNSYLNKHLQAIQKFSDYLRQSGRLQLPKLYIPTEKEQHEIKYILTQEEIGQLYKVIFHHILVFVIPVPGFYYAVGMKVGPFKMGINLFIYFIFWRT